MYKLPSVHKKCRQTSKFPSYLKGRHPQYKINCRILESQSLVSLDCNVTINKDNLSTSIFKKHSLSLVLTTIAL